MTQLSMQSKLNNSTVSMSPKKHEITIARGDGIGPEIMQATLDILEAVKANIDFNEIEIGEKVYLDGISSGIHDNSWDMLRKNRVLLKAPITTPRGGGFKSLNVTIRKTFGLYANIRPCMSYHPVVPTKHPEMDVIIVRENEEDTYGGIEHRQTHEVTQCLKLITTPGSERVIRYAFEYAKHNHRKKVTCMVKDNIMKLTDGLFHKIFDEISKDYPELEHETYIIDIGSARLATTPEQFDVIVTPNLYGDIISDIAAQMTGSVGLAGSSNIGDHFAMFEAIHGSAPDLANQNVANPTGLIIASVLMLLHLNENDKAELIHNALLKTIEDGIHTQDLYRDNLSTRKVKTNEFASAVIDRLGTKPEKLHVKDYSKISTPTHKSQKASVIKKEVKELVGIDVFLQWDEANREPKALGKQLENLAGSDWQLKMITNRGVKVYPEGFPETFCTDHWRCRFVPKNNEKLGHNDLISLLKRFHEHSLDFIKTENLYTFDGKPGYSLGQGE